MFANYIKVAFRNLIKKKMYAMINILGLGSAISFAVLGYVNWDFSESYDIQHVNAENIFRVNSTKTSNNVEYNYGRVPHALAPSAMDISGVTAYSRLSALRAVIRVDEHVFSEILHCADYSFFNMFTFPVISGNLDGFKARDVGVITEKYAAKYFGNVDPVGKDMTLVRTNGEKFIFKIIAVTEDYVMNSSMPYNIIIPYDKYHEFVKTSDSDWYVDAGVSFLMLDGQASSQAVEQSLQAFLPNQHSAEPEGKAGRFYLDNLRNIAKNSSNLRSDILMGGMHPSAIIGPPIAGLMILLVACFNFLQTSISAASGRIKEIGIRKTLGSHKSQLIGQFLIENFVLSVLALGVGLLMSFWVVSFYDSLWPQWKFELIFSDNLDLFGFLAGLLLFTGLASGVYPALFISRFQPVAALKGDHNPGGKERLKKALFTGQFSLTVMTVLMTFILIHNSEYQRTVDLGFDRDSRIVVPLGGKASDYFLLDEAFSMLPAVVEVAATQNAVGRGWVDKNIENGGVTTEQRVLDIGEKYFDVIGFDMVLGEKIDEEKLGEAMNSVVVNEKLVEELNWVTPLDEKIRIDGKEYNVTGVMENFYHAGLWRELEPFILRMAPKENYNYATVLVNGDINKANKEIESEWKKIFPDRPYTGFYQEEIMSEAMMVNDSIRKTGLLNSFATLLISCMGLFAIVSLTILKRRKEIGIRKVLGASNKGMAALISKEFLLLLAVSATVGTVGGYYLIDMMLKSIFAHVAGFSIIPIIYSCGFLFIVAAVTVSGQVLKAASANPVDSIRAE